MDLEFSNVQKSFEELSQLIGKVWENQQSQN